MLLYSEASIDDAMLYEKNGTVRAVSSLLFPTGEIVYIRCKAAQRLIVIVVNAENYARGTDCRHETFWLHVGRHGCNTIAFSARIDPKAIFIVFPIYYSSRSFYYQEHSIQSCYNLLY